ncbi:hypothetical protein LTS09_017440 [Friedmanniomyces endolithicus]|nr:hypothetical protein LTS09_017440 [Friedmanniomyces endolithicus]
MSLAPSIEKDGFAYVAHAFLAQASDHIRHCRATLFELRELLCESPLATPSSTKDPPAHWYESQLIHYGLRPSNTKSVAKLRLLEAINSGDMVVPQHLQDLETELRKKWTRLEREAKKQRKDMASPVVRATEERETSPKTTKVFERGVNKADRSSGVQQAIRKRKVDGGVSHNAAPSITANRVAVGKLNQTTATERNRLVKGGSVGRQKLTTLSRERGKSASASARGSRPHDVGRRFDARSSASATSPNLDKFIRPQRQTARRSKPFRVGNRFDSRPSSTVVQSHEGGDQIVLRTFPRRPLGVFDLQNDDDNIESTDTAMQDVSYGCDPDRELLENLKPDDALHSRDWGANWHELILGKYDVRTSTDNQWAQSQNHQSTIILTSHGDEIWGSYDFGMFNGVIRILDRRVQTLSGSLGFLWRGIENSEGVTSYDDHHQKGKINFAAGGIIDGTFDGLHGVVSFQGLHAVDQRFNHERVSTSLRIEWESYSEEAYESARMCLYEHSMLSVGIHLQLEDKIFVVKLPSRDKGHDPLVHEDVRLVITDFAVCRLDQSINSRAKLMDDGLVDRASRAPKSYSVRERNASE